MVYLDIHDLPVKLVFDASNQFFFGSAVKFLKE